MYFMYPCVTSYVTLMYSYGVFSQDYLFIYYLFKDSYNVQGREQ